MTSLPILYSFRRCPYAIRARLTILISGQRVELREVNLKHKPENLLKLSSKATVPILVLVNNEIIDESIDIMYWAKKQALITSPVLNDFKEINLEKINNELIFRNDSHFKPLLDRYKYAAPKIVSDEERLYYRSQGMKFIYELEQLLNYNVYLCGPNISLADIAIFPFVRQFRGVDDTWFNSLNSIPKTHNWLNMWFTSMWYETAMKKQIPWRSGDDVIYFPK
jgi:glutathione S-transferase